MGGSLRGIKTVSDTNIFFEGPSTEAAESVLARYHLAENSNAVIIDKEGGGLP